MANEDGGLFDAVERARKDNVTLEQQEDAESEMARAATDSASKLAQQFLAIALNRGEPWSLGYRGTLREETRWRSRKFGWIELAHGFPLTVRRSGWSPLLVGDSLAVLTSGVFTHYVSADDAWPGPPTRKLATFEDRDSRLGAPDGVQGVPPAEFSGRAWPGVGQMDGSTYPGRPGRVGNRPASGLCDWNNGKRPILLEDAIAQWIIENE